MAGGFAQSNAPKYSSSTWHVLLTINEGLWKNPDVA